MGTTLTGIRKDNAMQVEIIVAPQGGWQWFVALFAVIAIAYFGYLSPEIWRRWKRHREVGSGGSHRAED
jgi:hypothetical protein